MAEKYLIPTDFLGGFAIFRNLPNVIITKITETLKTIPVYANRKIFVDRFSSIITLTREKKIKSVPRNEFITHNVKNKLHYKQFIYLKLKENVFTFKISLKHIALQIEEAKEILSYQKNWDDENAEPTDDLTFLKSAKFLFDYSSYIEGNYGIIIPAPYMDILKDGSIYLNWEMANSKFLIIFKKNMHPLAYFYGERIDKKENKIPFKSAIEVDGDVDEITAQWMKTYLV